MLFSKEERSGGSEKLVPTLLHCMDHDTRLRDPDLEVIVEGDDSNGDVVSYNTS